MSLVVSVAMMLGMRGSSGFEIWACDARHRVQQQVRSRSAFRQSVFAMRGDLATSRVAAWWLPSSTACRRPFRLRHQYFRGDSGASIRSAARCSRIIIGLLENVAQYIDSEYLHWGNLYEIALLRVDRHPDDQAVWLFAPKISSGYSSHASPPSLLAISAALTRRTPRSSDRDEPQRGARRILLVCFARKS